MNNDLVSSGLVTLSFASLGSRLARTAHSYPGSVICITTCGSRYWRSAIDPFFLRWISS